MLFSSPSFHSNVPSSILCSRRLCDVDLFSHHLEWCFFVLIHLTGVLCTLLKFFSFYHVCALCFNRSAVRICSSLKLFPTGVLSTLFYFVAFLLSICSTSQGSLVSLICQRGNLAFPFPLPLPFFPGAILDLGMRSSCSGGVL